MRSNDYTKDAHALYAAAENLTKATKFSQFSEWLGSNDGANRKLFRARSPSAVSEAPQAEERDLSRWAGMIPPQSGQFQSESVWLAAGEAVGTGGSAEW